MVSKLIEKSLLNYEIVAAVSVLDLSYTISSKGNAEKKFTNLVEMFYERVDHIFCGRQCKTTVL